MSKSFEETGTRPTAFGERLRREREMRGVSLDEVITKVTAALAKVGGADPYSAPANAIVIEACANV